MREPCPATMRLRLYRPKFLRFSRKAYLTLALEAAYRAGQKPVTPELIASVLARGLDDIEPTLARHGYTAKALADVLHVRPAEMRAFLRGRLPAGRAQELQSELRAVGLPL